MSNNTKAPSPHHTDEADELRMSQEVFDNMVQVAVKGAVEAKLEQLITEQKDYIKATNGHIKNSNSWSANRGTGKQSKDTLTWLESHLNQLKDKETT